MQFFFQTLQLCSLRNTKKSTQLKKKCACPYSCACGHESHEYSTKDSCSIPNGQYQTRSKTNESSWTLQNDRMQYSQYQMLDDPYPVSASICSNSAPSSPDTNTFDTNAYSDMLGMPSSDYFQPDEIFQLDQPIRNYGNVCPTFNGMSPTSGRSSAPTTLLDLDSIQQRTFETKHESAAWITDVKYESCDETSSLTSTSSQFDEAYYTFQQHNHAQYYPGTYNDSRHNTSSNNQFFDHCENVSGANYHSNSYSNFNGKIDNYSNYGSYPASSYNQQWNQQQQPQQEFVDIQSYGMTTEFSSIQLASSEVHQYNSSSGQHQLTYASV